MPTTAGGEHEETCVFLPSTLSHRMGEGLGVRGNFFCRMPPFGNSRGGLFSHNSLTLSPSPHPRRVSRFNWMGEGEANANVRGHYPRGITP